MDARGHRALLRAHAVGGNARIGEQPVEHHQEALAVVGGCEECRQRRERLLGLVAADDLLTAADAVPLVGLERRQQIAVVTRDLRLQLDARERERLAFPGEQARRARERFGVAAFIDGGTAFDDWSEATDLSWGVGIVRRNNGW